MENTLKCILEMKDFEDLFYDLYKKDYKITENIRTTLKYSLNDYLIILNKKTSKKEEKMIALLKMQIKISEIYKNYKSCYENLLIFEQELLRKMYIIDENFFNIIYDSVDEYFSTKKTYMHKEIMENSQWYTGILDTVKTGTAALNIFGEENKTLVEKILKDHLCNNIVAKDISDILVKSLENYKENWIKVINENIEGLKNFKKLEVFDNTESKIDFRLGATEQTFFMGLGSAVVGAVGLAAGWNTITYAFLNIFPPVAFFTAAMTAITAVYTNDKAIKDRLQQIDEIVNNYYRIFLVEIDRKKINELGRKTLREYIKETSTNIVNKSVKDISQLYLGSLNKDDYNKLLETFEIYSRHIAQSYECISKE